jgi:L-iditol 2-dehydrogenase
MKAQVFYEPENMKLERRAVPTVGPDDVLVHIHANGICGSDVAYYFGKSSLGTATGKGPLVLGHECSGVVAAVGDVAAEKGKFKPGDRVVINPVQSDPSSKWTKRGLSNVDLSTVIGVSVDGGLAEYCRSHWFWTVKVPEHVSLDVAASTEPLACAVYAVQNAQIEPGSFVVVFGPGPVGLMMVQLAKAAKAGKVLLAGTRDDRLQKGKELGADLVANTKDPNSKHFVKDLGGFIRDHNGGELADRAITSTSSLAAIDLAMETTGRHSTLVIFGLPGDKDKIPMPALQCMLMDKTIRYSWLAPTTWPEAIDAIATGKVKIEPIQTHRFPLDDLKDAIHKLREREDKTIKTLIQVGEE